MGASARQRSPPLGEFPTIVLPVKVISGLLAFGLLVGVPTVTEHDQSVLVAEVLPLGLTVTAIAVRLEAPGELADRPATAAAFEVLVSGQPRTVIDAYTNSAAERTETPVSGEWLVLELEPVTATPNDAYAVEQTTAISMVDGVSHPPGSFEPSEVVTPLVDRYEAREQEGPNRPLRYRLFVPEDYDAAESYPLVLTLHGYGESGPDNEVQLTANQLSTAFASPGWQERHPAFVVSPQLDAGTGPGAWSHADVQATLIAIIESLSAEYSIDPGRLYVAGLSMGSLGAWDLLAASPRTFAGALLVAYGGGRYVSLDTPLWNIHSVDDDTVPYSTSVDAAQALEDAGVVVTRGEYPGNLPRDEAREKALEQWRTADERESSTLFTAFTPGTTGVPGEPPTSGHLSWVDVFSNEVYLEWLFSQSLPTEAPTEVASPVQPGALVVLAVVLAAIGVFLWRRGRRARIDRASPST